jgi:flagellin-like protein
MNRRALSPVVASIILIAVTVAVSIAVAAWMGALTVGFMENSQEPESVIHYNGLIEDYYFGLNNVGETGNLTLVQGIDYPTELPYIRFYNGTEFVLTAFDKNVSFLLTDYDGNYSHPPTEEMEPNTEYPCGKYSLWFYQDLKEVGKTAYVLSQMVTAWKEVLEVS